MLANHLQPSINPYKLSINYTDTAEECICKPPGSVVFIVNDSSIMLKQIIIVCKQLFFSEDLRKQLTQTFLFLNSPSLKICEHSFLTDSISVYFVP